MKKGRYSVLFSFSIRKEFPRCELIFTPTPPARTDNTRRKNWYRKPLLLESVLWQSPTTMRFPALHGANRLPKHFRSCKFSPALKSVQKKIRNCIFWDTALMAKMQTCKPISLATACSGRADGNGCYHFWRKRVFPLPSKKSLLRTMAAPRADRILQKPCF